MNKNTTTTLNGQTFIMGADPYIVTADPDHTSIGWKLVSTNSQLSYEQEQKIQRIKELAAEMINTLKDHPNGIGESTIVNDWLYQHAMLDILSAQMKAVKYLTFKY